MFHEVFTLLRINTRYSLCVVLVLKDMDHLLLVYVFSVPFLLNRLSTWVFKLYKSFSLVLFIWNGHVLWKWATLQREEMLSLEVIYMNLGEVARMVPFLHQLVPCAVFPHPWEWEEEDRREEVVNNYEKDFGKFFQYSSPSKTVTPWWFSLLQLLVPQLETMRDSHKSFKPLLKFTINLGT